MAEQPDENQIELYLIGALPEIEAERLDEMSLTDDVFADRLSAVENDLVDAYARGELSAEMAEGFKSHYLSSPRRRGKVRFAEALLTFEADSEAAALKAGPAVGAGRPTIRSKRLPWWTRWVTTSRPAWAFGAAAVVVLVALAYLALENRHLRSQMARMSELQQERAELGRRERDLEEEIDNGRTQAGKMSEELAQVRERLAQLEQQAADGHNKPETGDSNAPIAAFTLGPPIRGAASIPTLAVPRKTGVIALQLELESDDFPAYQAALKNPATGQTLWTSGRIKSGSRGQHKVVSLKFQARLLGPGIFHAELAGVQQGKPADIIATYPFRIVIQ